jgi:peptidoglycan hydrolase-like amidase
VPGAPFEALKAQAVVTRSSYVSARNRHPLFDFCDTTHCQFLRQAPGAEKHVDERS